MIGTKETESQKSLVYGLLYSITIAFEITQSIDRKFTVNTVNLTFPCVLHNWLLKCSQKGEKKSQYPSHAYP